MIKVNTIKIPFLLVLRFVGLVVIEVVCGFW